MPLSAGLGQVADEPCGIVAVMCAAIGLMWTKRKA